MTINILVVDDSVLARRMISNVLEADPALCVIGVAANGKIALAKLAQVKPDVVILDVAMPEMDGLETLAAIRQQDHQLPVIMYSVLTERGAAATLDALSLGATDYVAKPQTKSKEEAVEHIQEHLVPKIKAFCANSPSTPVKAGVEPLPATSPQHQTDTVSDVKSQIKILAIGVSTGGPKALEAILPQFPANFPIPIVIVQHMPPVFTTRLAERLAQKCQIKVVEGYTSGQLEPGLAWIAPGDYHLIIERNGKGVQLRTHQDAPENSCRPAVDVLFRSVAKLYGANTLAIILTGMGQDGRLGCECIRQVGGQVWVQDEATSVVWGMPGMVANSGLADRVIPLPNIAAEIIRCV
ncbi:MAG: chemotaxis response regulator protein-glutamate methylesterase [Coleofasciculus sp. B1-GNL1-01]|uniref:protein-glutamate methylesterase/protein-glutamine glutaminase n=1 Tax=Coleofasciculus sp. B1-GNL1-01 TaxID=3068484 RepID=UPI003304C264